jgi:hypothetical protein
MVIAIGLRRDLRQNSGFVPKEIEALKKEMRTLR